MRETLSELSLIVICVVVVGFAGWQLHKKFAGYDESVVRIVNVLNAQTNRIAALEAHDHKKKR